MFAASETSLVNGQRPRNDCSTSYNQELKISLELARLLPGDRHVTAIMCAILNFIGNVYNNFNQFSMAGLMTAPLVLIELLIMRAMGHDSWLNTFIFASSIIAELAFFLLIWQQAAVTDKRFRRSMIPQHAGAILMC